MKELNEELDFKHYIMNDKVLEKIDVVIEFHRLLDVAEEKFFQNRHLIVSHNLELEGRVQEQNKIEFEFSNPKFQIPFFYDFTINAHLCRCQQYLEIEILD